MGSDQLLEQARHTRDGLTGLFGQHQGVPGRDHGAGKPRGQNGVVDVRDDPEGLVLVDHMDRSPVRGPTGTLDEHLVPSNGQTVVADPDIYVAAPVGLHRDPEIPDHDLGPGGHLRGGDEIAPSATMQQVGCRLHDSRVLRGSQHDPRQDTNLTCGAETGVRGDAFLPAATQQETVQHPVQAILDAGGEEGPGLHGVSI